MSLFETTLNTSQTSLSSTSAPTLDSSNTPQKRISELIEVGLSPSIASLVIYLFRVRIIFYLNDPTKHTCIQTGTQKKSSIESNKHFETTKRPKSQLVFSALWPIHIFSRIFFLKSILIFRIDYFLVLLVNKTFKSY